MLNKIKIRPARVEDASQLASAERLTAQTPGNLISVPDELRDENFANKIAALADHPLGTYVVATLDGVVAGHALLDPMELLRLKRRVKLSSTDYLDDVCMGLFV